MTRDRELTGWLVGLFVLLTLAGPTGLGAQARRDSLIARAKDEFDGGRRIQLLMAALDPTLGPPTSAWGDGAQALAQALIDDGQAQMAATWLRWAVRLSGTIDPDTVQYTPQVTAALRAARDFVNTTRSSGDSLVSTTWNWPAQPSPLAIATVQVDSATTLPLQVTVTGSATIGRGARVQIAAGSHEILVSASGYDSVRVTRETLPGIMAILRIRALPRRTPVTAVQPPARQTPATPTVKKKKFPWPLAILGAVGGGAAILLLGGGGESSSSGGTGGTGGITFHFPDQ